ncbi:uncharacterized protein LACBIDRAFT_181179 [Laccaria bicolor S238N-H82]|uniref:Predicted protein n=1 Tax=Laccaria bicolor (strain S238N-H82 / ATCC MYA-4686) TaxID=486041 RepID=B0CQG7_LACBS|nr:uncharacterized protein LACBIDRAFT_181179 [Laccaria bicolor S238N-H82]EDR15641.1 predicted protein [Laccaria bicolor S238N-H82]|eukprot:XP_001873849.1 predicted protein [Laccaria bicolor S238N-H82]
MDTLTPTHDRGPIRVGVSQDNSVARARLDKKNYALGLVLLLVVVFLWTSSNFVTQVSSSMDSHLPCSVTYMNTSAFSFYLIPWLGKCCRGQLHASLISHWAHFEQLDSADQIPISEGNLPALTAKETSHLALVFCLLWFVANWTVNASLDYTSVASATVLSSTSGFFTLGIGRLFRVEKLTIIKVAAVFTSFTGVVLVSLSDSKSSQQPSGPASRSSLHQVTHRLPHPILGDTLALISALFYALYVILLKVRIKSESRVDMQLFFGFVGLFSVVMCWPVGLVLHLTGGETFELPRGGKVLTGVLINMAITLSSDYLYVLAMLKTTPLVVTVGLSLTIPLAVLGDFIRGKDTHAQVIFGAALVLISFIALGLGNGSETEDNRRLEHGAVT